MMHLSTMSTPLPSQIIYYSQASLTFILFYLFSFFACVKNKKAMLIGCLERSLIPLLQKMLLTHNANTLFSNVIFQERKLTIFGKSLTIKSLATSVPVLAIILWKYSHRLNFWILQELQKLSVADWSNLATHHDPILLCNLQLL